MAGERAVDAALVLVPGLDGAAWPTARFVAWRHRILVTAKLPDLESLDAYAAFVAGWAFGLRRYVLVGDTFGALIALAVATCPTRARAARADVPAIAGVVLSGAFRSCSGDLPGEGGAAEANRGPAVTGERRGTLEANVIRRRLAIAHGFDAVRALERLPVPSLVLADGPASDPDAYALTVERFVESVEGRH